MVHLVPYRKMSLLMIEYIVVQVKSMLNVFPSKTGISTTMSARNILEVRPSLDLKTMSLNLGASVQLFGGTKIYTTQQVGRSGCIKPIK